jgi:hypothetical protein
MRFLRRRCAAEPAESLWCNPLELPSTLSVLFFDVPKLPEEKEWSSGVNIDKGKSSLWFFPVTFLFLVSLLAVFLDEPSGWSPRSLDFLISTEMWLVLESRETRVTGVGPHWSRIRLPLQNCC